MLQKRGFLHFFQQIITISLSNYRSDLKIVLNSSFVREDYRLYTIALRLIRAEQQLNMLRKRGEMITFINKLKLRALRNS